MDNELLYCGIENLTHWFYTSFYLSIILSLEAKVTSQFFQELCELESSNMENICRMNNHGIVGLRFRVMAFIFMPPTSKKLRGNIGLCLSIRLSVCPFVHLSVYLSVTLFGSLETQEPLMLEF